MMMMSWWQPVCGVCFPAELLRSEFLPVSGATTPSIPRGCKWRHGMMTSRGNNVTKLWRREAVGDDHEAERHEEENDGH